MPFDARLSSLIALVAAGCGLGPLPAAAPPAPAGPVALLVGPDAGAGPVLDLIASARASLWMEMYQLTDARAVDALVDRARAGCDVRITLEPAPYESPDANQAAFAQLAAAGILVRWSTSRFAYTHAKAFTIDHARLVVMTLNLTGAGLERNREFAAVDDDPADVAAAEALFAADGVGTEASGGARLVASPDGSRQAIRRLVDGATLSLALETEELTDGAVVGALVDARARGVAVTVVWPGPAEDAPAAFGRLAAAGAVVRAQAAPSIHAKAVVADGRSIYLGSANLTPTSLDRNRELGLALDDAEIAAAIGSTVSGDAARGIAPPP